jgi:hypothetical protein
MSDVLLLFFRKFFHVSWLKHHVYGFLKIAEKKRWLEKKVFIATICSDIKMKLHLDDFIQQLLFFTGEYEMNDIRFMLQQLQAGSTMIDIGANTGLYSLFAAQKVGSSGRVIALSHYPICTHCSKRI